MTNSNAYFPSNVVDTKDLNTGTVTSGLWRDFTSRLPSTSQLGSNNYKKNAESIRKKYADYFFNEGSMAVAKMSNNRLIIKLNFIH